MANHFWTIAGYYFKKIYMLKDHKVELSPNIKEKV